MNSKDFQALLRRRFHLPKERPIKRAMASFTLAERAVFSFFTIVFILSGGILAWKVSQAFLVEVPTRGGSLIEGIVGNPRFINPVLALSEADKNLTSLIYSGLVKVTPEGDVENDLADSLTISDDKLVYTVSINSSAKFQDNTSVTADDVLFTIQKVVDPLIKSPRRGNWEGISVEKIDAQTVQFTLKKPYAPFIYNLALGILPKHIWKNVTDDEFSFSQFNTLPIGTGPYQVESVERNSGGIPDYYKLTPFEKTLGSAPYIRDLIFRFYSSESALIEAYNKGNIESLSGLSPELISELKLNKATIVHAPLPRIFAVFFNQSQSKVLLDKSVRTALDLATPKDKIVEEVLGGYGTAIHGPFPAGLYSWAEERTSSTTQEVKLEQAQKVLESGGWKAGSDGLLEKKSGKDTMILSFSISTGDAPELKKVAEELKLSWEKLGAKVEVLVFETGELNQSVIRPRHFDALLFGEVVGREADLYPFWHSSQRNDPGLNIALYANSKADKLLEEARSADRAKAEVSYKAFEAELEKDLPAIFLYSPNFLYVVPEKLQAVRLQSLSVAQDRFLSVRSWYVETDKVWKIFLD